jgi:tellurite methyltransferase
MERPIVGFDQDEEGHWVAALSCGHSQHTRHDPPFSHREWVLTEEGRNARLGAALDCVLCERAELPATHAPYQRTKTFTQETVPAGLLSNHTTKKGVWGLIHVEAGALEYAIEGSAASPQRLESGSRGVVVPEVVHRVKPLGEVEFYVEFWRKSEET